jgi:catechol-2,3-dioxygenase
MSDQMPKVIKPSMLAHVVLNVPKDKFKETINFYEIFLGGVITFENEFMALLTYDEEHHRVAVVTLPGTSEKVTGSAGMEHFAFTFKSLDDLALAYTQRKAHGIIPAWCVNHGPTTSMYYNDPAGNKVETQVDNYDTAEEITKFMVSPEYAENPIGTDFDPEDLVGRLQSGESHASIKKRIEIGPRAVP